MDKTAETLHPVHPLIAQRWSPRAFAPRPVSREHLRSLLEAARWAASSFNEQPWTFLVARREEPAEFKRMLECLVPGNQAWAQHAPVLMLTVVKRAFTRGGKPNRVAEHDVGLAAAQLTLQAESLGLRVHQMGGIELDKIRSTYGLPVGYDPLTGIAVGYEGEPASLSGELHELEVAPRERRPQEAFVFEGSWGRPASF